MVPPPACPAPPRGEVGRERARRVGVREGVAAVCEPCARRPWERSAYFRAMPVFDPQFTVVDLETGDEHGPYDSWEDIALALAFARLSPDRVEVITDAPAIMGIAAWE